MTKQILKTIVGSQAHGLATPESDFDYRGVFVQPTNEILAIGPKRQHTNWTEDNVDDTSHEIGHFLFLATKSNPTILEVFLAPIADSTDEGLELRSLFPYVWESLAVRNAFIGYGLNQRKKFLDNKDKRREKYAAAYLRVLYNAYELLTTGTFTVRVADTEVGETVRRFKSGDFEIGEVIQVCSDWQIKVEKAYDACEKKEADKDKINEFLLKVRKEHWK